MSAMTDDPTTLPPPPPDQPGGPDGPDGPEGPGDSDGPGGPGGPRPRARLLRRSLEDRVVGGVAAGLGAYFDVDPVLFRVLFATTAFFGGAGVLAYGVAWAVVPEEGATDAPLDRAVEELQRRHIPVWLAITAAVVIGWSALFSWWVPWGFGPVVIAAVILAVALSGRPPRPGSGLPGSRPGDSPGEPAAGDTTTRFTAPTTPSAASLRRDWRGMGRQVAREKRRRKAPVRWATLAAFTLVFGVLVAVDAARGIPFALYFWALLVLTVVAVTVGAALRRASWGLTVLVVPAIAGLLLFAGTPVSLHDGSGDRVEAPHTPTELHPHYDLAFGGLALDLTDLGDLPRDRTVHVTIGGGRARVVLPSTLSANVHAHVKAGNLAFTGVNPSEADGVNVSRDLVQTGSSPGTATIDIEVVAGRIEVQRAA